MESNDDIRLELPSASHYAAFKEAAQEIHDYMSSPDADAVKSREMKGFIFGKEGVNNISQEDFTKDVVKSFADRRLNDESRPSNPHRPEEKVPPNFTYFIMKQDQIIGIVSADPKQRSQDDIDNGVKSYSKWEHLCPNGVRVESATTIIPSQQGKGYANKAKHLFFKNLRKEGVEQIIASVNTDNTASNAAQKSLCRNYGGNSFKIEMKDARPGYEGNSVIMNRYVVDITSLDNEINKENNPQTIESLRGLSNPISKQIKQTSLDINKTNTSLEK